MPSFSRLDSADLLHFPPGDTLVLTVNNRMTRRWIGSFAAQGQGQGSTELPRILPVPAWLQAVADDLSFDSEDEPVRYLDGFAARLVWEQVIAEETNEVLLDSAQAARLAADADLLLDEWALEIPSGAQTEEYLHFLAWRERYDQRLAQFDAEDANRLYARVGRALHDARVRLPAHIVLAGFTEISPRLGALLEACEAMGSTVNHVDETTDAPGQLRRHVADDPAQEWVSAARWAVQQLAANPQGRYAIVSLQLERDAATVRRVLAQAFEEAAMPMAVNVSVGRALDQWPVVRAALAWLEALATMTQQGRVPVNLMGRALLAGHCVADRRQTGERAALDARWRRQAWLDIDEATWLRELQNRLPDLLTPWTEAAAMFAATGHAVASVWAQTWQQALTTLGFPGSQTQDSTAYQALTALAQLLARMAALDAVAGALGPVDALMLLTRLARESVFQPQRDPLARLDVMGTLEAEGGRWDGVWILGLTDDVIPASPAPNPLLPQLVLRRAGAPHASPEREREWAEHLFAALCRAAPTIMVSHAHMDGQNELRPSPLIAEIPKSDWVAPETTQASPFVLQHLDDEHAPPLSAPDASSGETRRRSGGVDVLDTQARNPLWAFVRHRLGARALDDYATRAATALARGQFMHGVLELAWRQMESQQKLHELIEHHRLNDLLESCMQESARRHLADYTPALRALEIARARGILQAWFDLEVQRAPFDVASMEEDHVWQHGALSLTLRLDRLDRMEAGGAVILDYKTGLLAPNPQLDWARPRPISLQLPLYAAMLAQAGPEHEVTALALVQLHAREVTAKGLSEDADSVPGLAQLADNESFRDDTSWQALLQRWREAIEALADEFSAGYAANLTEQGTDLKYCDALPFLRLYAEDDDV